MAFVSEVGKSMDNDLHRTSVMRSFDEPSVYTYIATGNGAQM